MTATASILSSPSCSGLDPMEDTESRVEAGAVTVTINGCSGLDPMEDTESGCSYYGTFIGKRVAVGSIRWRILKVRGARLAAPGAAVAVGSIRWRILKDAEAAISWGFSQGLQWARSDGGY